MTSISCTIFIPDQIFSFLLSSPTTSRTSPVPLMSAVLMHADVACRRGAPQAARHGQPAWPGCAARAGLCVWPAGAGGGGGGGGGRVLRAGAAGSGLRAAAEEEEEQEPELPSSCVPSFREAGRQAPCSRRGPGVGRAGRARGAGTLSPATRSCQAVSQAWRRPPPAPSPSGLSPFITGAREEEEDPGSRSRQTLQTNTHKHGTTFQTVWPPGRPMVRHRHGAGGHLADGQPGPGRERSGSGRPTGRGAPDGPTSELERLKCAEWHALATFITTERPPATPPGRSRVKMVAAPAGPHP